MFSGSTLHIFPLEEVSFSFSFLSWRRRQLFLTGVRTEVGAILPLADLRKGMGIFWFDGWVKDTG